MVTVSAQIDAKDVQIALGKLTKRATNLRPVLTMLGEDLKLFVKESIEQQKDLATGEKWKKRRPISAMSRAGGAGGKTLFDNGHLLRSFAAAQPTITDTTVSIGSNLPYARIHQVGGVIKAKGSGVLMIPMSYEAKKAGSARRFIDQKKKAGESPFFMKTKKGRLLLVYYKGKKGERSSIKTRRRAKANPGVLTFAYYCPKSVTIPARPYLGYGEAQEKIVLKRLRDHFTGGV